MDVKIFLFVLFSFVTITLCVNTVKISIIDRPKDCTRKVKPGDKVSMHYDGFLSTGKPFDSSRSRNSPFIFQIGAKQVIDCWENGIPHMCVGEKRKLTCPPEYAYGDKGFGDIIPAKSTLIFEVELLDILTGEEETKQEPKEKTNEEVKEEPVEKPHEHEHEHEHEHGNSFEDVDKDGNGEISREEMTKYIRNYQPEIGEDIEQPEDEEMSTLISEIFQADDTNKDGVLSKEEFYHGEEIDGEGEMLNEMNIDEKDLKDEL